MRRVTDGKWREQSRAERGEKGKGEEKVRRSSVKWHGISVYMCVCQLTPQ